MSGITASKGRYLVNSNTKQITQNLVNINSNVFSEAYESLEN